MRWQGWMACAALATTAVGAAHAATPRELLVAVAFDAPDKRTALAGANQALAGADSLLAANPKDHDGLLAKATAIGYRAKLTKSPADAKLSRQLFDSFAAANPRDPEGQLSVGGWHLDSLDAGFLTATVLGAKKELGLAAIDRAVALGGNRAVFKGFAALMRARLNPADPTARTLAEQAAAAPAPTPLDQIAKRDAAQLLVPLRSGDGRGAQTLARRLLPLGRL